MQCALRLCFTYYHCCHVLKCLIQIPPIFSLPIPLPLPQNRFGQNRYGDHLVQRRRLRGLRSPSRYARQALQVGIPVPPHLLHDSQFVASGTAARGRHDEEKLFRISQSKEEGRIRDRAQRRQGKVGFLVILCSLA